MAFPTTGIIDDFAQGDEGPPITDWTDLTNGLEVVSNEARGDSSPAYNWSSYDVSQYGADCEVYCTMVTLATTGGMGILTRQNTLVAATVDGYEFWYSHNATELAIYRIDNGASTKLGIGVAWTGANGDKLGGESIGSTHKLYVKDGAAAWAEKVSRSDSDHSNVGYLGADIYYDGTDGFYIDDFGGGTVAAAGLSIPVALHHYMHQTGR
jgi:hypothetical protein